MKLVKIFNPTLYLLSNKIDLINKVFGDLSYDMSLSDLKHDYRIKDLKKSIISTEVES